MPCMLHGDGVNLGALARVVDASRDYIVPVDPVGIDIRVESLAHVGGQGLEHVGGAGASVRHVDKGELNAVSLPAVGDLA
jgi:hypothetical protein